MLANPKVFGIGSRSFVQQRKLPRFCTTTITRRDTIGMSESMKSRTTLSPRDNSWQISWLKRVHRQEKRNEDTDVLDQTAKRSNG